jgi:small subunit ribosomal protein S2
MTISKRIGRLKELEDMEESGELNEMPKKEATRVRHQLTKLRRNLEGLRNMERLPAVVFIIDPRKEHIALMEARKLGIPVVAVVDTNCDPDLVDYVIPGNDDAIRAANLISKIIANAVLEGQQYREAQMTAEEQEKKKPQEAGEAKEKKEKKEKKEEEASEAEESDVEAVEKAEA